MRELYKGIYHCDTTWPENAERLDLAALPLVSQMERNGMLIDRQRILDLHKTLTEEMETYQGQVNEMIGRPINLGSGDQLAALLYDELELTQPGKEKKTKSRTRLTVDSDVLKGMVSQHDVIKLILEYKVRDKLRSTYTHSLLDLMDEEGYVHPDINHTGTDTGRYACSAPNLTNIPQRTKLGKKVRKSFVAGKGKVYGTCDLSQIEMRHAGEEAKCPNLIQVFLDEEDLYWSVTENIYKRKFTEDDRSGMDPISGLPNKTAFRQNAKIVALGTIYDISPEGLVDNLLSFDGTIPFLTEGDKVWEYDRHYVRAVEICEAAIKAFFEGYPELLDRRREHHRRARTFGRVWDCFGRHRWIPQVFSTHAWVQGEGLRAAGNMPIQGCQSHNTRIFVEGRGLVKMGETAGPVSVWDGSQFATGTAVYSGYKKQLVVELEGGQRLECSPEHPILIATPKNKKVWKTAGWLLDKFNKLGDTAGRRNYRACIPDAEVPDWEWEVKFPYGVVGTSHNFKPCSLDHALVGGWENLGEWLGRLASDGNVTITRDGGQGSVRMFVADHEMEILSHVLGRTTALNGGVTPCVRRGRGLSSISITSLALSTQLDVMGIKDRIPESVWMRKDLLRGYLRGMFDGDGTVNRDNIILTCGNADKHLDWFREIQEALLLFGIRSKLGVYDNGVTPTGRKQTRINLVVQKFDVPAFASRIGFMNSVKQAKAEAVRPNRVKGDAAYGWARGIRSVRDTGLYVPMYDVVNSSTGRFCANGVIVHNSCAGFLKLWMAKIWDRYEAYWKRFGLEPRIAVHDEIIVSGPQAVVEDYLIEAADMVWHLLHPDIYTTPLESSIAVADDWGSLEK